VATPHLVDAAVDELFPSLLELAYGGQVAVRGSFQEQARGFVLCGLKRYEVSNEVLSEHEPRSDYGIRIPSRALAQPRRFRAAQLVAMVNPSRQTPTVHE
jgi:hypothetical protein